MAARGADRERYPVRAALLGLLLAVLGAGTPAVAQDLPRGYEEGIFEVVVPPLRAVSVPALVSPGGKILLPLRPVLELTGAPFEAAAEGGRVSVARPRGAGTAVLDLAARTIAAARTVAVAEEEAARAAGDVYLSTERLADLLEAAVSVDAASLTITLTREPPFPAQERVARAAAREAQLGRPGEGADGGPDVPFTPRTGGGVLEWGVSSRFPDASVPSSLYARTGLGVWGGMLRLGATMHNEGEAPAAEVTAAYHRVFPGSRIVRQLQVGDLVAEGLRARSIRGVSVTNAPFVRDAVFGEAAFAPRLPAGWEYEVYQNGQLLGFSSAAGTPVAVPLRYGSTPVQVRLYGPAGERVTSDVVYLVPSVQLPAGRFQYAAGAGLCPGEERCGSFSYLDLRRGMSDRLTAFAGVEAETDSAGAGIRPYGGFSFLPAASWAVDVQAMPGAFVRATAQSFGAGTVTGALGGGVTWPGDGAGATVIGSGGFSVLPDTTPRWHGEGSLRLRFASASGGSRSVDLSGRMEGSQARGMDRLRFAASTSLRGFLVEGAYESFAALTDSARGRTLVLGRVTAAPGRWAPRWLYTPLLTASAGYGGEGVEQWEAGVMLHPPRTVLSATLRWARGAGSPALLLGSTVRLGVGRAQARFGQRGGATDGAVSVDGGLVFGRGAGVAPLPYGGLGLTGVSGRVFHDRDGDGRFGAGDEPVANAFVGVGSTRARTDAAGRYATWSVLPYEVLAVRLDTASLADPMWTVARRDTLIRPSPHVFTPVDFPLAQTRELAGRLTRGPGIGTAGGVTLELADLRTGEVQRIVTFSDGEFYVGRLFPGEYELRVAATSLTALRAAARPASVRVQVPASGDAMLVEAPPIQLVRAAPGR